MKALLFCCIVVLAMLIPALSYGQSPVFSVKPGLGIQSSHIGLSMGRMIPYFGVDLLSIGVKGNYSETDWGKDWQTGVFYKQSDEKWDLSGSATLLIPHIGIKFLLPDNKLRPYCFGDLFKSFAFVSVDGEDLYRSYNPQGQVIYEDVDDLELEKKEKDAVKDILGVWGFNIGFGVEYPVSERFSIGGEYGVRLFFTSTDYEDRDSEDWDGDGVDDWREKWKGELSGSLKISHAAGVLNFHF